MPSSGQGRPKKKRRPTNWMHQADTAFSKWVRARDGHRCQAQGAVGIECKGHLQCCHIMGRGELVIRTDEDNAIAMCQAHHVFFGVRDAQWQNFIEDKYPGRRTLLRARVREHVASGEKAGKLYWQDQAVFWKEQL